MHPTIEDCVTLVVGRQILRVPVAEFRRRADAFGSVVVDLGAGDGRHALRLARARPEAFVVAVDADTQAMRESSARASRRPERGGAPNAAFVRAAVEALPGPLCDLADEVLVLYPWGSLLRGLLRPEAKVLAAVAGLARPGARLHVRVNASALADERVRRRLDLPAVDPVHLERTVVPAYGAAGWEVRSWRVATVEPETPWARRLGRGRPLAVLEIRARWVGRDP